MGALLPDIDVPLRIVLVAPVFFVLFIGLCFWVYQGRRSRNYEKAGRLPFDD